MIQVGMVGTGFIGMIHYLSYEKTRGARVTALCDTNRRRLAGDWRDIKGNFGPRGKRMDLRKVAKYTDFSEMLADPAIDLIDVCLPTSLHADFAIQALRAGKHVFCEKPMALTPADTRRMVRAAERADRLLMIGHVLPMFPEYRFALQAVRDGKFGRLLGGHFQRVISNPTWVRGYYDAHVIGGPMLDLHVHDAHFIRLLFGMPARVHCTGRMQQDVVKYFNGQYAYDDQDLVVTATCGVVDQPGRSFLHGYEIHLEKATIVFEFAVVDDQPRIVMPCTVLPARGKAQQPALGSGDPVDAFLAEIKAVIAAIRTDEIPDFLSAERASDAMRICQQATRSVQRHARRQVGSDAARKRTRKK